MDDYFSTLLFHVKVTGTLVMRGIVIVNGVVHLCN